MQTHRLVLLLGLIASCTTPAGAQTTAAAPANVFLLAGQLQAAKAAAAKQQKPIALIYADPYTTAPTKRYANTAYIDGLKTRAVVVVGVQPDYLPPPVAKDIRKRFANTPADMTTRAAYVSYVRPDNATDLPIVYLMDGACQKILFATNGSTEIRSRLKTIQQKIAGYTQATPAASGPAATSPASQTQHTADIPGLRTWKSSSGVSITAAFAEASDGFIMLKRSDGRTIRIMLQHLSEADQLYLASAHGIRPPEPETEPEQTLPTEEPVPTDTEALPTEGTPPAAESASPTDDPLIQESPTSP